MNFRGNSSLPYRLETWLQRARLVRYDAVLSLISGIICVVCAVFELSNHRSTLLRKLVVGSDGYDVIRICIWLLLATGGGALYISVTMGFGQRTNANKYTACLVVVLVANFVTGLLLTDFQTRVGESLPARLSAQLEARRDLEAKLGFAYGLGDVWDRVQTELGCCGVEAYKDYTGGRRGGSVPDSCCVMRSVEGRLVAENIHQCQHDALLNVHESIFIHTRGCRVPLSAWFTRHVSVISAVTFSAICCQAVSILYLSWQGFKQPKDESVME